MIQRAIVSQRLGPLRPPTPPGREGNQACSTVSRTATAGAIRQREMANGASKEKRRAKSSGDEPKGRPSGRHRRRRGRRRNVQGDGDERIRRRVRTCSSTSATRSLCRPPCDRGGRPNIRATLEGEDLGLFIGRHGQTIDAVQHLAFKAATRDQPPAAACAWSSTPPAIASGASRRCSARPTRPPRRPLDAGRPVALDAMSATERKVVHEYLKDRDDVETYSEGTEPDRHLVVAPLETSRAFHVKLAAVAPPHAVEPLATILQLQAHDLTASTTIRDPGEAVQRHVADRCRRSVSLRRSATQIADLGRAPAGRASRSRPRSRARA